MLIRGSAIAADIPSDPGFKDRFWYWTGASGRKYIHSVYGLDNCPPLPGAIYVAVQNRNGARMALDVGRFTPTLSGSFSPRNVQRLRDAGIDEIHVHLLARNSDAAEAILDDLLQAFHADEEEAAAAETHVEGPSPTQCAGYAASGFSEPSQLALGLS